jgi:hypothetical protein
MKKAYMDNCEHLGVPPKLFLLACATGFSGCAVGGFLAALDRFEDLPLLFMMLGFAPHVVVGIHAGGTGSERAGKIMLGALLSVVFVFFPGGGLGVLLAQCFK